MSAKLNATGECLAPATSVARVVCATFECSNSGFLGSAWRGVELPGSQYSKVTLTTHATDGYTYRFDLYTGDLLDQEWTK